MKELLPQYHYRFHSQSDVFARQMIQATITVTRPGRMVMVGLEPSDTERVLLVRHQDGIEVRVPSPPALGYSAAYTDLRTDVLLRDGGLWTVEEVLNLIRLYHQQKGHDHDFSEDV